MIFECHDCPDKVLELRVVLNNTNFADESLIFNNSSASGRVLMSLVLGPLFPSYNPLVILPKVGFAKCVRRKTIMY